MSQAPDLLQHLPPHGLSSQYWNRLSDRDRALYQLIRPIPSAIYSVQYQVADVETFIATMERDAQVEGGSFELEPDFQRGHVWSDAQRSAYIEALFRGQAPAEILFNCPGWSVSAKDTDIGHWRMQCIDGLQRLTAIRRFAANQLEIFGSETTESLAGTAFSPKRTRFMFTIKVYAFERRADLLGLYLDLNGGGTVHSEAELSRVRLLHAAALESA